MTKVGVVRGADGSWNPAQRPAELTQAVYDNLRNLGVDVLDVVNLRVMSGGAGHGPSEGSVAEQFSALADLRRQGLIRHLGLSNVVASTIAPVVCVQNQYNLAHREDDALVDDHILPTARELGIGIVAYRVLADGLLSGVVTEATTQGARHFLPPRLEGDNLRRNVATAAFLKEMAAAKGATPAQLAVAWLLSRGDDIVPLVGMSRRARLPENLAVLDIRFSADELAVLERVFAPGAIVGDRYPALVQQYAAC